MQNVSRGSRSISLEFKIHVSKWAQPPLSPGMGGHYNVLVGMCHTGLEISVQESEISLKIKGLGN